TRYPAIRPGPPRHRGDARLRPGGGRVLRPARQGREWVMTQTSARPSSAARWFRDLLAASGARRAPALPVATPPAPDLQPEVDRLTRQVARLTERLREQERLHELMAPLPGRGTGRPSWQASLRLWRRHYLEVARLDAGRDTLPHWRLPRKLFGYRLAASHGVRVP